MFIPALMLALFFACANSRMLLGSSDDRRTFYHSLRDVIVVEDVDFATGFKYGECSHLVKGKVIRVSFFAGRFYPHYELSAGDAGYLSNEAAYKACIENYKKLKIDVLYDIGLTALALADFAKELGMTGDLNAVPALEFVINNAKRNIDKSDKRRLALSNPKFVENNLKYGSSNSEDVRFGRPQPSVYKELKDFSSRPLEDIYFQPKDSSKEKYDWPGQLADRPNGNYYVGGLDSQADRIPAGGLYSQRDRFLPGGPDSQGDLFDAGFRTADSRGAERDLISSESGGHYLLR